MDKGINNNGYDYVDLGLPSGTLWATCNVGASKPIDYGLYFQWGDTQGCTKDKVGKDKYFEWSVYKWYYKWAGCQNFTKYTIEGAKLDLEDDAAHVHMGGDWHMPTPEQIKELIDNTTSEWTTLDGVDGRLFTSRKDESKFIFIPAAGNAGSGLLNNHKRIGSIWSSILGIYSFYYGQRLYFDSVGAYSISSAPRYGGLSVRGVIDSKNNVKKNIICRLIQKLTRFISVFKILEK